MRRDGDVGQAGEDHGMVGASVSSQAAVSRMRAPQIRRVGAALADGAWREVDEADMVSLCVVGPPYHC